MSAASKKMRCECAVERMYGGGTLTHQCRSYMADATGQPLDKIEEDTDRDFFMTPEEAQEYGIIDEVASRHTLTSPLFPPSTDSLALGSAACACVCLRVPACGVCVNARGGRLCALERCGAG